MSPQIKRLMGKRPTYGYRRITAFLNRERATHGLEPINHKRIYRIMASHGLLLAQHRRERPERVHDGKVVTIRSNLRWCSDGFEFACWNGEPIRVAFVRDNWLSNRVFKRYDDIVAHCCESWNKLMDQPWRISSIGRRSWAHKFLSMSVGKSPCIAV